jgi:hypothetical protein
MVWLRLRSRKAEKVSGLIGDVAEFDQAAALADDIEKVTMLSGRRVGLMCS